MASASLVAPTGPSVLRAQSRTQTAPLICYGASTSSLRYAPPALRSLGHAFERLAQIAAAPQRGGRPPARGNRVVVQASGNDSEYSFMERDYHRVTLLDRQPYGPMKILPATDQNAGTYSGVLVFQREAEQVLTPDTSILEIFVAGDTATNIYTQLHNQKATRPMVHDLMFNMLTRAAATNAGQWQLLRVAIVALENDIFVGRLFFGDPVTGAVAWDCDCRPSDGVYLSLRTGCSFYVARSVWEQAAVPIRSSKVHMIAVHEAHMASVQQQAQQQQVQQSGAASSSSSGGGSSSPRGSGSRGGAQQPGSPGRDAVQQPPPPATEEYAQLKSDDLDAIKLLKRELAVAVREEDYAAAVRLRDHPYMQMYRRIEALSHLGRGEEAERLQAELVAMIQASSKQVA